MFGFHKSWIKIMYLILGLASNNVFGNNNKICISPDGPKEFKILQKQTCDLGFYSEIYGMHFFKIRDRSNAHATYVKILEIGRDIIQF